MKKEWLPSKDNLDEVWAYEKLTSMSESDIQRMLSENPSTYTELLAYAQGPLFILHMNIIIKSLLSDGAQGNFALADGFIELCLNKSNLSDYFSCDELAELKNILKIIAKRQDFYDADIDIFGDFKKRISEIKF